MRKGKFYKAGDIAIEVLSEPIDLGNGKISMIAATHNIAGQRPFFTGVERYEFQKDAAEKLEEVSIDILKPKKHKGLVAMPDWIEDIYNEVKK